MSTGTDNPAWVRLAGAAAGDGWDVDITDGIDGWQHTGLLVTTLAPGEQRTIDLGDREAVVLPLSGGVGATAEVGGQQHSAQLVGRDSVWAGATDVAYVPTGSRLTVRATDGACRVAICLARDPDPDAGAAAEFTHLPAESVPVELRGAGISSRQVRNFATPGVLAARRMIAVEVITPAGNWSSWPPHKHDTNRPGVESELEEIYYYHTRSLDPRGTDPVGYQRVYGTAERPIDVIAEVRTDDVVLVPHGWHGPAIAPPDADLYYLNVMAGPGAERIWLFCDDPAHGWIRESWTGQQIDPRLT